MLTTDQTIKLISPIILLIISEFIRRYMAQKPRLISFLGHVSSFKIKDTESSIYTHSIIVRNTGNKLAKNVRLGHNFLPTDINVFPAVQYSVQENQDGAKEIVFPVLVPKEQVTISYLYFPPLAVSNINSYTKSDEGFAKIINAIPTPQLPKITQFFILALLFLGASLVVYWLLNIVIKFI